LGRNLVDYAAGKDEHWPSASGGSGMTTYTVEWESDDPPDPHVGLSLLRNLDLGKAGQAVRFSRRRSATSIVAGSTTLQQEAE
jgi:hypothetical protein